MLTVTTAPRLTALTTLAAVREQLNIDYTEDDAFLMRQITRASATIMNHCNRTFARAGYHEAVEGTDRLRLMLSATPLRAISALTFRGAALGDWYVERPDAGFVQRPFGWASTAQASARSLAPHPLPNTELPWYEAAYIAGYLLPGDDRLASRLISADATSNAFLVDAQPNDPAKSFPMLLGPTPATALLTTGVSSWSVGDDIEVQGFTKDENNGIFQVVSATPTSIVVSAETPLQDEAKGPYVTLLCRTLPADIEEACLETVSTWYLARKFALTGPRLIATGAGSAIISSRTIGALPETVIDLLKPWARVA